MLYRLTFRPIFKERVWRRRKSGKRYCKPLPLSIPIGASWEISYRPGKARVIANGPLAGKDLQYVMQHHHKELLGHDGAERFPLLIKILDAQEKLSLQVHPPASVAASLKGEPKTEMWYITDATPTADLFVGL